MRNQGITIEQQLINMYNYPVMNDQFKNFMSVLKALDKKKVKYILNINIATPETLYNLKKDTVRYKDKFDAAYLKELINKRKSKNPEEEVNR